MKKKSYVTKIRPFSDVVDVRDVLAFGPSSPAMAHTVGAALCSYLR